MDPAQGKTQGKSITSKLKAKVKGVKGKVHLPGHKKRHGDDGQANEGDSSSSDHSSDDSPKKPGPETGYNLGGSTPFTTVRTTPLSPVREKSPSHDPHTTSESEARHHIASHSPAPTLDEKFQYREAGNTTSTTEGMAKMEHDDTTSSGSKPREGVLGKVKDSVGGAAAAVGSKMGYYTEVDQAPPADPDASSVVDTPRDPNAPSLVEKTKATLGLGPRSATSQPSQPGVVDRVTGAMSSLFTSSPKESSTGEDVQHTFPAQSDYVPPAAPVAHQSYGDRSGEERMTTTPIGGYDQAMNRY